MNGKPARRLPTWPVAPPPADVPAGLARPARAALPRRPRPAALWVAGLLLLAAAAAFAADPLLEAPLQPPLPGVMGQGGAVTASADAFSGLFWNPAALATPRGRLTIYSLSSWLYAEPLGAVAAVLDSDPLAAQDFVDGQIEGGGFGFGVHEAISYAGRGAALGVTIDLQAYLRGSPAAAATGDLYYTVALYSGFAFPLQLGRATLKLGALARPMFRLRAPVDYTIMQDLVDGLLQGGDPMANLNAATALYGIAVGVDAGALLELGPLRVGATVTDLLGTRFHYSQDTVGNVLTSLQDTGGFPDGAPAVEGHYTPADLSVGAALSLRFGRAGRRPLEAVVHASLADVLDTLREGDSPLLMLHAGGELTLFQALALRAGYNQGYLCFGLGARLYVLDLDLAYFARETAGRPWGTAGSGLSLQAALRLPPAGVGARRKDADTAPEGPVGKPADGPAEQP